MTPTVDCSTFGSTVEQDTTKNVLIFVLILEVQTYRNTHIENHETFECRLKFVK